MEEPFNVTSVGKAPFLLGVASGDPRHDRVLLWTRLSNDPHADDGRVPPGDHEVEWVVAKDKALASIIKKGVAIAKAEHGHAVRVDVEGLEPATTYFYAFRFRGDKGDKSKPPGGAQSITGRTRTLPAPDAPTDKVRFIVASCQNWQEGHYTAHAHLAAEEDIDFVLFLGDYIYEEGITKTAIRPHEGGVPETIEQYRRRHALYKTDPHLQAAHAAHPWIVIWDDHEVAQNYASSFAEGLNPEAFLHRRAAAYKAYWEHLPLRADPPTAPEMGLQVFRDFVVGDLLHLAMLDGRQFKSKLICDGKIKSCDDRLSPVTSMLGTVQESWLTHGLRSATKQSWKVIGNNVMMSPFPFGSATNNDQWDGFSVERQRIFDLFGSLRDVIVFTGDVHATLMCELPKDASDPGGIFGSVPPRVGLEIVTTAISSSGANHGLLELLSHAARRLPYVKYINSKERGYLLCELTHQQLDVSLRAVSTVMEETATIRTANQWRVLRGSTKFDMTA